MMPCTYLAKNGSTVEFDLDAVFDVVAGYSIRRADWTATVIFVPSTGAFVELRSSAQDYRGNSEDEAEEVDDGYIKSNFAFSEFDIARFKAAPREWQFLDRRRRNA